MLNRKQNKRETIKFTLGHGRKSFSKEIPVDECHRFLCSTCFLFVDFFYLRQKKGGDEKQRISLFLLSIYSSVVLFTLSHVDVRGAVRNALSDFVSRQQGILLLLFYVSQLNVSIWFSCFRLQCSRENIVRRRWWRQPWQRKHSTQLNRNERYILPADLSQTMQSRKIFKVRLFLYYFIADAKGFCNTVIIVTIPHSIWV